MFYKALLKLAELDSELIKYIDEIDNFFSRNDFGDSFSISQFSSLFPNGLIAQKIINTLVEIGFIERSEENAELILINSNTAPIDSDYLSYKKNKQEIVALETTIQRIKHGKIGFLLLIDLRGYTPHLTSHNEVKRILILEKQAKLRESVKKYLAPYFLSRNTALRIKDNGDSALLIFQNFSDLYEFSVKIIEKFSQARTENLKLDVGLKLYAHKITQFMEVLRDNPQHIDINDPDMLLVHTIEKPIEKILLDSNLFNKNVSAFLALTESCYLGLDENLVNKFSRQEFIDESKSQERKSKTKLAGSYFYYEIFK